MKVKPMEKLVKYYKAALGCESCYAILKQKYGKVQPHVVERKNRRVFLDGYSEIINAKKPHCISSPIENTAGLMRIDVPVWFGSLKAKVRIMVVGQNPGKAASEFNLERRNGKIFAAIFAANHWHLDCTLHHAKHLAYLYAFEPLLQKVRQSKWFVLFTDLQKHYFLPRKKRNNTDRIHKLTLAGNDKKILLREREIVAPTHIIAVGDKVATTLGRWGMYDFKVKHPAGWQNLARIEMEEVVRKINEQAKNKKRQRNIAKHLALLIGCLAAVQIGTASNYYVSTNGNDSAAGTNWATAKKTIQSAVNCTIDGDTVWVTNGTYVLTNQVSVNNGITVQSVNGASTTIVNGNYPVTTNRCFYLTHSNAVLDGFAITKGYIAYIPITDGGGGVCNYGTVENCTISENDTGCSGGGVFNYGITKKCMIIGNGAKTYRGGGVCNYGIIENCTISENNTDGQGGGVYNQGGTLRDCIILGNISGASAGGVANYSYGSIIGVLTNCLISGNRANSSGGGVFNYGGGVQNCTITGNASGSGGVQAGGGGIYNYSGALQNCTISGNISDVSGGGVYNRSIIDNCIIAGNTASSSGGGIYNYSTAQNCLIMGNMASSAGGGVYNKGTIQNCTVSGNTTPAFGGALYNANGTVANCIAYYNENWDFAGTAPFYSCAPGLSGNYNITIEPCFYDHGTGYGTNHTGGNFRLQSNSPCINTGVNQEWMLTATDLDGNDRIVASVVDMGAYEYNENPNLQAPANVQASDGTYTNKIRVSWNAVGEAKSYQVWRNASNDSTSAILLVTTVATACDDTSATTPGLTLYYWIKAKNDSAVSAFSQPDAGYCGAGGAAGTADLALRGFLFQPAVLTNNAHPELVMLVPVNNGPDNLTDSGIGFDFFLSRNTIFGDDDDEWIGDYAATVSIAVAGYTSVIVSDAGLGGITIPPAASGAYYVFAKVRHTSALLDPNMTNNVAMRSGAITVGVSEGAKEPVAGDFDGDRLADPCVYQESTGNWSVKLSAGGYGLVELDGFGGEGWKATPGDYDGDRKADPAIYQESTGNWRVKLSGSGYADVSTSLGGLGYVAVSGDFNGGGNSDLAVYREATGYWLCLLTETETPLYFKFGQDGYAPVTGDYTGDGITDLALYQESSGSWFVKQDEEIYSLTGFGGVGYQPVVGDYDGDGKADLMLYQADGGNWMVRLSGSGYALATLEGFGGADYLPVSGDYDGDRKADLVLYNTATATWLFRLSAQGYAQVSTRF